MVKETEVIKERGHNHNGLTIHPAHDGSALIEVLVPYGDSVTARLSRKQVGQLHNALTSTLHGMVEGSKRKYSATCEKCGERVILNTVLRMPSSVRIDIDKCPHCGVKVSSICVENGKYILF